MLSQIKSSLKGAGLNEYTQKLSEKENIPINQSNLKLELSLDGKKKLPTIVKSHKNQLKIHRKMK
jgi:hypothetical protein